MKMMVLPVPATGYYEMMTIEVPAKPKFVKAIRLAISGLCDSLGMSYDEIEDVKLAVSEACSNTVKHAYAGSHDKGILTVRCYVKADELEVVVQDSGKGFDPALARKFDIEKVTPKGKNLGLGLHLMRTLMDRVDISSGSDGTLVYLHKRLHRRAA